MIKIKYILGRFFGEKWRIQIIISFRFKSWESKRSFAID